MKKRLAFKKGRFVLTRQPHEVLKLSEKIVKWIKPFCKKIEIAGSIRRKEPRPVDIDLVIIPKNKKIILDFLKTKGRFLFGGEKKEAFKVEGVKVELYFTDEKSWGAMLLAYSSKLGPAIGLRVYARRKDFKLNQYGLFDGKTGKYIAGKTEKEIYNALGKKYKAPEKR